jgi:hypothetical protein
MILAWMVHTAFQLYVCAWRLPILPCMSVRERGRNGRSGNEDSLGYDVRFAIKACRAAAKVMGGSLAAGITFTEEQEQGSEEFGKETHDYHHGGDGADSADFPFQIWLSFPV